MNSLNRYYLPASEWSGDILTLEGDEAHHCVRVLRQKAGDEVIVFDGEGRSVQGVISSASKEAVVIEKQGEEKLSPRGLQLSLCQSIPKGGNMELIVQKAVELGVSSIQPLVTENTVVKADEKKRQKWQRVALEACKQCGQDWLPEVAEIRKFTDWLANSQRSSLSIVAALDPRSREMATVLNDASATGDVELLIGPEGDFSQPEYDAAISGGFEPVSLGNIVLRVETATLYCLSVLRYACGRV
ncbi:ribosomal RNA small subunit methyltransferase E [Rubritalea halochordaticola]|uniref:Ribosomal RNA small subunit methyltransferase E n=1 Tax=Rubritalea halochordaticola TaxID=714537 RepID=A0ABP9V0L6_9BACT